PDRARMPPPPGHRSRPGSPPPAARPRRRRRPSLAPRPPARPPGWPLARHALRPFRRSRYCPPLYARQSMQTAGDVSAATGPVKAAEAWIEAVPPGRYDRAWAMTDPRLRLVRGRAWIWHHREDSDTAALNRDELARPPAQERPKYA